VTSAASSGSSAPPSRPQETIGAALRDPLNLVALTAGVVWLAVALFGRPVGDYGVETDFYGDFVRYAREWMHGSPSVMNGFRGPLYYLVLGVSSGVFRDAFLAGKILSAVSAALGIRVLGGLLRRLFGPAAAVFGALFVAANAVFVELAIRASTDAFYWLLFVSTVALLLRDDPRRRRWGAAGLCAGAAFLTRYNGTVLLAAGLLVALGGVRPQRAAWSAAGVFALGWVVLAGPWLLFVWWQTGDPFWNQAFQNVAVEVYVSHPVFAQNGDFKSAVGMASLLEVIRVDPAAFLHTLGRNLFGHVWRDAKDLVALPWAAVALAGFAVAAPRWRRRSSLLFAGMGVLTYLSTLPVFYGPRFMLPLLPWWGAGVGCLAAFVWERRSLAFRTIAGRASHGSTARATPGRERKGKDRKGKDRKPKSGKGTRGGIARIGRPVAWAMAAAFVALAVRTNVRQIQLAHDPVGSQGSAREILDLARSVRQAGVQLDATTPIAARKPHIGYYLDAPVVSLAGSSVDALRERGAHYLLVTAQEIQMWPALRGLLQDPSSSPLAGSLHLVARTGSPATPGRRSEPMAALFEVTDPAPYEPPAPSRPHRRRDTIGGLDRLDTLRLRLAQWYQKWDWRQPVAGLVSRMSEAAHRHPAVLVVEGDAAMRDRDLVAAEDYYREAVGIAPDSEPVLLRLAGAVAMRGKQKELDALLRTVAEERFPGVAEVAPEQWWDVGTEVLDRREFTEAIAPLARCIDLAPPGSPCAKLLGKTFIALEWFPEARNVLTLYGQENPSDQETRELLRRLAG
jgi:hypothetical protein